MPSTRFGSISDPNRIIRAWDGGYRTRTRECGVFLVCEPQFIELHQPPILTDEVMLEIIGRIPPTRNPSRVSEDEFAQLQERVRI
jgi:hypothetical protein